MKIKKLINSEKEYIEFVVNEFLKPCVERGTSLWREEDLPTLEPFFKFSYRPRNERPMTDEEEKSYEHYKKCWEEYASDMADKESTLRGFEVDELAHYFLCFFNESASEGDDWDLSKVEYDHEQYKAIEFPCVAVVAVDSSFDRVGDTKSFFLEFVEKSMFDPQPKEQKPDNKDLILERLRPILADLLYVDRKSIHPETTLIGDLGADELDIMVIIVNIEDEWMIGIEDEEAERLETVADVVDLIQSQLKVYHDNHKQ